MLGVDRKDALSGKKIPLSERLHRRDISAYSELAKKKLDQSSLKKNQNEGLESSRTSRLESSRGKSRNNDSENITARSVSQTSKLSKSKQKSRKLGNSLLPGFTPLIDDDPYGQSNRHHNRDRSKSKSNSTRRRADLSKTDESDQSVDLRACFALVKQAMLQPKSKKKLTSKLLESHSENICSLPVPKPGQPQLVPQMVKPKKKAEKSTISISKSTVVNSAAPTTQKLVSRIKKDVLMKIEKPVPAREPIFKVVPFLKKPKVLGEQRTRVGSPPPQERSKSKEPKKPKLKSKGSIGSKVLVGPKKSTRNTSPKAGGSSAVTPSQITKNLILGMRSNVKSAGRPRKLMSTDEKTSKDHLDTRRLHNSKEKTKKKHVRSGSSSEERPTKEHSKVKPIQEPMRISASRAVKSDDSFEEPVRVNSKEEIYKKFAEIAAESERKMMEFLKAAEPLSSTLDSNASILNEYRRRAQHCIGVLRQPISVAPKVQPVPSIRIPQPAARKSDPVQLPDLFPQVSGPTQTVTSFLHVTTMQQGSGSKIRELSPTSQKGRDSRFPEVDNHSQSSIANPTQEHVHDAVPQQMESPRLVILSPRLNNKTNSAKKPRPINVRESALLRESPKNVDVDEPARTSSQAIISTSSVPLGIEPLELLKQKASSFQVDMQRRADYRSLPESPGSSVCIQVSPSKINVIPNRRVVDEPFPVVPSPVCHTPRQPAFGVAGLPELHSSRALHQSIEKKSRRSSSDTQGDGWKHAYSLQASPHVMRPIVIHNPSPRETDGILLQNSLEIIQADDNFDDIVAADLHLQQQQASPKPADLHSPTVTHQHQNGGSATSRLHIHSHTSKSLHIKDLGSGEHPQFGERTYPDLLYVANNLVEPFCLVAGNHSAHSAANSPGNGAGNGTNDTPHSSQEDLKISNDPSDLAVEIVDQALAIYPVDENGSNSQVLGENGAKQTEEQPQMFATPEEKSDIITSFILENLIIEALSEDFCLNKFLVVLGPHQKHVELVGYSTYLDRLFCKVKETSTGHEGVARKLNTPIGHTDLQRLLLATPSLGEQDQETLAAFEYEPVLDIRLYISLEEELREGDYEKRGMDGFEMEKEHILHKMLFDALNECLDYRRKGGVGGQPLKFLSKGKEEKDRTVEDVPSELEQAKQEVLKWASMRAGAMMEKEPQLSYHANTQGLDKLREKSMLLQIKEYVGNSSHTGEPDRKQMAGIHRRVSGSLLGAQRLRGGVFSGRHAYSIGEIFS